jgi:hypothetical protein
MDHHGSIQLPFLLFALIRSRTGEIAKTRQRNDVQNFDSANRPIGSPLAQRPPSLLAGGSNRQLIFEHRPWEPLCGADEFKTPKPMGLAQQTRPRPSCSRRAHKPGCIRCNHTTGGSETETFLCIMGIPCLLSHLLSSHVNWCIRHVPAFCASWCVGH